MAKEEKKKLPSFVDPILSKAEDLVRDTPETPQDDNVFGTFESEETEGISGVETPDGRTFLGLNLADVEKLRDQRQAKLDRMKGLVPVADLLKRQRGEQQRQTLGSELQQRQTGELDQLRRLAAGESFQDVYGRKPTEAEQTALSQAQSETDDQTRLQKIGNFFQDFLGYAAGTKKVEGLQENVVPFPIGGIGGGQAAPLRPLPSGTAAKITASGGVLSKLNGLTKGLLTLAGVGGAGAIFKSLTTGKVKELESDITNIRTSSRDIVTDVTKGSDPLEAIETLRQIEEQMIETGGKLHIALQNDFSARLREKDIEDFMFRNLNAVIRRRQALERYMIDGDVEALSRITGETTIEQ